VLVIDRSMAKRAPIQASAIFARSGVRFEGLEEVATGVRPAADLDDRAVAIEVVVHDVGIGDQVARVAVQELIDGGAVVPLRVGEEDVLVRRDGYPEVAGAAPLLSEHQDTGRVHAQVGLLEGVGAHRVDERPHQLGHLLVPPAQRRLRDLQPFPRVDPFQSVERLVVLPATDDSVGEHPRPGDAVLDRHLDGRGREDLRRLAALAVLADVLLVDEHHRDRARGPPLQDLARLRPDQVEGFRVALDLRRDDLDLLAREIRRQWLAHRLRARVLGDRLLDGRRLRRGDAGVTTEREAEHQQRELRVVLGQSFCLLTQQTAFEPLDLFA